MTQQDNSVLVSIIIPAYNTARYIHRAIESCLRQTHSNIEILIINDGSIDDTLEVARSFAAKDSRIRVFTQENAGVSVARNKGIDEAKGEYLLFVDSDDWLEPEYVEVLLDAQIANPGKVAAVNYWLVFDGEGDNFVRGKAINQPSRKLELAETIYEQSNETFPQTSWAKIFSADIIRRNNLRFRNGVHSGQDQLFALEYTIRTGGSVYVDRPLYDYYLGRSLTVPRKTSVRSWHTFNIETQDLDPEVRKAVRYYRGKTYVAQISYAVTEKKDSQSIRECRKEAKPFIRELLASKHLSFPRKLYMFIAYYFPIPLARPIISFWQSHKPIPATRPKEDSIPRW